MLYFWVGLLFQHLPGGTSSKIRTQRPGNFIIVNRALLGPTWNRDSSVGIAMGYGLDGRGLIPGKGKRFFSTPQLLNRLWGPPNLLSNGYM
jgi:hypothetical protein